MKTTIGEQDNITPRQENLLRSLIYERIPGHAERERWLAEIDGGLSRFDASELISSFFMEEWR